MTKNCLLAGVGGQGIVLASQIIAEAAMRSGFEVRTAETIGMAQRGGSVASHVRIGERIHSPLMPRGAADVIMAFEPAEAVRALPYLAPDGIVIVCGVAIMPVTAVGYIAADAIDYVKETQARHIVLDGDTLISACGSAKTLNSALLGVAAAAGVFPFGAEALEAALKALIPERYLGMNIRSFGAWRRLQGSGDAIPSGDAAALRPGL